MPNAPTNINQQVNGSKALLITSNTRGSHLGISLSRLLQFLLGWVLSPLADC